MVFNCLIRSDLADVLSGLQESSHDLVMITGDQALTACHVASQVHIISKPTLILSPVSNGEGYSWVSPEENENIRYSKEEVEILSGSHDLCVGALKQAHVGVNLLNAMPPAKGGNSSSDSSAEDSSKPAKHKKSEHAGGTSGKSISPSGEGTSKAKVASKSYPTSHSAVNRHETAVDMQRQKLETATTKGKNMVYQEIMPHALVLMTDVFGNYVVQKFFLSMDLHPRERN